MKLPVLGVCALLLFVGAQAAAPAGPEAHGVYAKLRGVSCLGQIVHAYEEPDFIELDEVGGLVAVPWRAGGSGASGLTLLHDGAGSHGPNPHQGAPPPKDFWWRYQCTAQSAAVWAEGSGRNDVDVLPRVVELQVKDVADPGSGGRSGYRTLGSCPSEDGARCSTPGEYSDGPLVGDWVHSSRANAAYPISGTVCIAGSMGDLRAANLPADGTELVSSSHYSGKLTDGCMDEIEIEWDEVDEFDALN